MLPATVHVFVSSTWKDLEPERAAVERAVARLRETKFRGMEHFGSRGETTRIASLDEVDRSHVYVGIIAARYGSGITEAEYRRARARRLPCFIYFKADSTIPAELRETDPDKAAKLDALKAELKSDHLVTTFDSPDDLAAKLTADLHRWLFDDYLPSRLRGALSGAARREEVRALLDAVKDSNSLGRELLARLKGEGFGVHIRGDYVSGDKVTNVYGGASPPMPTLHQLRAPVGDFVGREKEIASLTATLRGGASAAISGISGMGGIGKTELALYVAGRLRDAYPDAQLVIDMRGTDDPPRDPADALAACIRAFVGLEKKLPEDLEELTRLYRTVLEGRRGLVLLDNASDGAQVRPLLPPRGSALLITSRNAVTLPRMRRVTLEQLSPQEARELLTGIAPRVPGEVADRICRLCGHLPLAVRAAGSLLDVTVDLDPAHYAEQLRDERRRLELIGAEGVDISVEASLGLSYTCLSPDAARVFRRLAVFPTSFDAAAEEAVCADPGHKHLSGLLRRSLVLYNPDTARYRLHDLARLFADSRLSGAERRSAGKLHAEHYSSVLDESDSLFSQGGDALKRGLALFDLELRNIRAGQAWAEKQAAKDERAARLCGDYLDAGGTLFHIRLHPREYIDGLMTRLAAVRRLKNPDLEGQVLIHLGWAFSDLGDIKRAAEFYEQALDIFRATGNRAGEGAVLNNLSGVYITMGEVRRALKLKKRVLVIIREEGLRREEGIALRSLGNAYAALGEARRALKFYEQGLNIAREIGDLLGEGDALSGIGEAHRCLGDVRRAVEAHERHLAISRDINNRRGEGDALCALGVDYFNLGNVRLAIEFFEQYLDITRELGDRAGECTALGNLGGAHATLGDHRRGIEFHEQCLGIARDIGDKGGEGQALSNLGVSYSSLGEHRRAIEFYEQALEISRQVGNRREEGEVLCNLGVVYVDLGESQRALELYRQQLAISREVGNRRGEGTALWNMSGVFYKLGDLRQAISHGEAALGIREEIEDSRAEKVRARLARWRAEATKK